MRLSEFKSFLDTQQSLSFVLPNGKPIPSHFHVTELGVITKNFMDCGGTMRSEQVASLQLWSSVDVHHRLAPSKLKSIVELAQAKLDMSDLAIEVEVQGDHTIEKYGLEIVGSVLRLTGTKTACLATDACGIPEAMAQVADKVFAKVPSGCTPGGNCC